MNWGIYGHKRQLDYLEKMISSQKLAHGFLFAGPDGVGKRTIALKLAEALGAKFPDLIELDGSEGVKIEQVRELVYKLSLKPYSSLYKVALIDHAEQMTSEAANALLKSLEEPKSYTIIILITSNPNRLPKTIISRTQKINFGVVNLSEYRSWLPEKSSADQKVAFEILAAGRPGLAHRIMNDKDFLIKISDSENFYKIFSGNSLSEKLISASQMAEEESLAVRSILENWLNHLAFEFRENPSMKIKNRLDQVSTAIKCLDQNANTKLLLTNLMLNT